MARDNRVGIDCGSGVGVGGQERATGENWDNCNRTRTKKINPLLSTKKEKNKFYLKKDKIDFCNYL